MAQGRTIETLVQESTPAIIAGKLRHAIGYGELTPGTRLGEADLAQQLGVSRGPLREAMQRLTQEGLLTSIRNRGLFVASLGEDDVRDIYFARTAVEMAALGRVMAGDNAAAAERLLEPVAEMDRASANHDAAGVGEADISFHEALVELASSPRLSRMHTTLLTQTRMCITALQETYPEPDGRVAEHTEIAETVRAGETGAAHELLQAHMDDAVTRLLSGAPGLL
ncbi:GntR family transcriptional regulator [Arthrobacter castelli]|uniref:GntR family transcriptional regulator n=1 Tax=Arthrobacter castelli TaxID=271431 RepID=UPI0004189506|nr:GntR family transcriptional regulator [Arthrobacter castelli]